jgi:uncharacterized protein YpiB (UPF0302 family)
MTELLSNFKAQNSFLNSFSFKSMTLNKVLNYYLSKFNPMSRFQFSFDIRSIYKPLDFETSVVEENHFDVVVKDGL